MELTAVFRKDDAGGFVAFVEELAGANTQGETLEEARTNLREAVALIIESIDSWPNRRSEAPK